MLPLYVPVLHVSVSAVLAKRATISAGYDAPTPTSLSHTWSHSDHNVPPSSIPIALRHVTWTDCTLWCSADNHRSVMCILCHGCYVMSCHVISCRVML